ncbi:hypothetical protein PMNALOAF_0324 [Methylobacterium adhaesivum]|uniref:Uncharacterized protein n=1 Tax=Methylobacterium adhaesivum TaxID=333297 RepID=A0ABT8BD76_9HYPH|nr:hypothetical protein [Methylobacterium adhaesivum]MDN3590029.1 hypothetical protein [Methylobacterium adhaesivum]GJD29092.1 hypothetical protein PMNALOAF_0324 [Methylobacterium adhaesivum]
MLAPRTPFIVSLIAGVIGVIITKLVGAALKAIYDVTIQDFWKDTIAPYLTKQVGPWSTAILEWIGPNWAGAISAFALMFVVEMIFAWRRRLTPGAEDLRKEQNEVALSVVANQSFVSCPIKLDGIRFINCSFEKVFVTWDGGPYSLESCQIDATRVDGFITNNPVIADQMRLFGILGLLHPKGARGMGLPIEPTDEVLFRPNETALGGQDFTYDVRKVENHWVLAITNNGDEASFNAKLDLDGLSAHWLRKPAETLDGAWGVNQAARSSKTIANGAREALYLFEVSKSEEMRRSFIWGMLDGAFSGVSSVDWEESYNESDIPHGIIRMTLRVSTQPKKIFEVFLKIERDCIRAIPDANPQPQ